MQITRLLEVEIKLETTMLYHHKNFRSIDDPKRWTYHRGHQRVLFDRGASMFRAAMMPSTVYYFAFRSNNIQASSYQTIDRQTTADSSKI